MKRDNLIKAREAAGLSQDDLAGAVGVTRWTINRIEAGERNPSFDLMQKIMAALGDGVSADVFIAPAPAEAAQ
jgi:putative transcriptional regulator